MKLPESGFGNLVVENFEKAIFGLVALIGLFMIYKAFSAEKYPAERVPEALIKEASRAKDVIHDGRWENYAEHYEDKTPKLLKDLEEAKPVEKDYPVSVFIEGERLQLKKRFDPVLLAVQDLEVTGVWDSILWDRGRNYVSSLPNGELRKRASKEKKKKKKKPAKRRPMRGGGEDEGMREMMEAMEAETAMMEAMEADRERMESGPAKTDSQQLPQLIADEMTGIRVKGAAGKGLVGGYFVNVTGVVPFRQQIIEFRKLSQTLGYDPQKDYPRYVKVDIERMDASAPDARWENITEKIGQFPEHSHMKPPEVCDLDYLDDRIAMQSLPLLRTDPSKFGLHSKVTERVWFEEEEEEESIEDVEPEIDPETGLPIVKKAEKKNPREMSTMDRMTMRMPTRRKVKMLEPDEAPEFKLVRFSDFVREGKSYRYRVRLILIDPNLPMSVVSGKEDEERGSVGGEGGDAMSEMEMMMRMQDGEAGMEGMDMESGRNAVTLTHGNSKINESNLEAEVRDRLNKLKNSARFDLEDKDLKFGLYTDWSEPSPVVTAPKPREQFFAGRIVESPSIRQHENVKFEDGRATVELVMSKWSPEYSYKLPVFAKVSEGSTMNLKQVIKLIDPIGLKIREIRGTEADDSTEKEPKYEGYEVDSSAVVLDISGGRELPNKQRSEKEFVEPTEVLMFDGENFVLTDELEDMREFREHALFEVKDE